MLETAMHLYICICTDEMLRQACDQDGDPHLLLVSQMQVCRGLAEHALLWQVQTAPERAQRCPIALGICIVLPQSLILC